jgi:hypothetical protein
LVFPVILLLVLGALTMVSRSTNSFLAASKQSDAQAARQAAESGLNRVLRVLSPFGKNATDPYMSFLLLSVWTKGSGGASPGWALTQLGRTAVEDRLRRCRISTRGMQPTQLVPNSTADYDRLMNDVVGTTADGKRTLRYRIVSYTPPERLETPDKPWPSSECGDFQTVSGGTALITIEGSVELNGNRLATQRLTRTIEVDAVPFPDLPVNFPAPGPPISLRISDRGEGLGEVSSFAYKELTRDPTPALIDSTFGQFRPQCKNCSPNLANGTSNLFPVDANRKALDLPEPFPVVPTPTSDLALPSGPTPYVIDEDSIGKAGINCSFTRKETEISCYIKDITVSPNPVTSTYIPAVGVLRVDTSKYPVNLYIYGNVGGLSGSTATSLDNPPTTPPLSPPSPDLSLNDGRVIIEHCVKNCTSATPEFYRHDDSSNNYSVRPLWSRFRIFGDPEPSSEQNFYIASRYPGSSGPTSLHGVFLWLPQGKLTYGLPTYTHSTSGWSAASPEASPTELLATWWIQNLSFLYLTGKLSFIQPLYGNPDAMNSILPGSYSTATNGICTPTNGICTSDSGFQEDPRFPVYPVLPRPRSTF